MAKLTVEQLNSLGLKPETLPRHVAIVMDGNGRWAQKRGLPRSFGHRAGTERLREIIRFSSDAGIRALTLYAFSTENWRRPEEEKSVLFSLLIEYFNSEIDELHHHLRRKGPLPGEGPRGAAPGGGQDPEQHRPQAQHRPQLRQPGGDPAGGSPLRREGHRAGRIPRGRGL